MALSGSHSDTSLSGRKQLNTLAEIAALPQIDFGEYLVWIGDERVEVLFDKAKALSSIAKRRHGRCGSLPGFTLVSRLLATLLPAISGSRQGQGRGASDT